MKTNLFLQKSAFLFLLCLICSCSSQKKSNEVDLCFPKENIISFSKSNLFKNKTVIPLEINEEAMIGGYPSLLWDGSFFIYSRSAGGTVLRFDKNGKFMQTIGKEGNGPEEYVELTDVCLDPSRHSIDILSLNAIYRYTYEGAFVKRIPIEYPAFSFYGEDDGCYWLYIGNNKSFSDFKLFKIDTASGKEEQYLNTDMDLLPISENNFHKSGDYTTFHESYNNDVYQIKDGSFIKTHTVSFNEMNLNLSEAPRDPMDFVTYLKQKHYATIRCYLENKTYVYLQTFESIPDNKKGRFYHWFINKKTGKNTVIEQPQDIAPDSYLYAPQLLTEEDLLYFIGYPLDTKDDVVNPDENPSVVIINISQL